MTNEDNSKDYAAPVDWFALDGKFNPPRLVESLTDEQNTLNLLDEFIQRMSLSYALPANIVPPCWFEHEALIHEILALYQYREQQMYHPDATPGSPFDFHYWFGIWRLRMAEWVATFGCKPNAHSKERQQPWLLTSTPEANEYERKFEDAQAQRTVAVNAVDASAGGAR